MPKYKSKMGNFSSKEEIEHVDKLCRGWKTIVPDTKLKALVMKRQDLPMFHSMIKIMDTLKSKYVT